MIIKPYKRLNIKELMKNPKIKRDWICRGTVVIQSREGIDVSLDQVYDMYDKFTSKNIPMPDGYTYTPPQKKY